MAEPNLKVVTPTEDAKAVRRKVYDAIEAVYDQSRKCYRRGLNGLHSDETIAKNVGCAVSLVEKVREEFFGPNEQNEPIEDIIAIQKKIAFIDKESKDHAKIIEGIRKKDVDLRAHLDDCKAKLKKLCEDHGWYH